MTELAAKSCEKKPLSNRVLVATLALFASAVLYLTICDSLSSIALLPAFFAICYCALLNVEEKAGTWHVASRKGVMASNPLIVFSVAFAVIFAGQLLYWLAYYPGGFNLDAYGQWEQAHGRMGLNNWHPVITTACYWLITQIYDSFAFCIFVQLIAFSLSASYLLTVLNGLGVSRPFVLLAAFYISLNPAIGMNNVCMFKDVPFAIAVIWMSVVLIRIVATEGAWLNSISHSVFLVANSVVIVLIRHNGIFLIAPVFLCLLILYRRRIKKTMAIVLSTVVLLVAIQGPVYSLFAVERHSNPAGEMVGIPMSVMANSLVSDPGSTPEEVRCFLLSIASEEEWKRRYVLGEWDSCKWEFGGIDLFREDSLSDILKLAISSAASSPEAAYQSIRENTRVVWQVVGEAHWETWVYIEANDYGIEGHPNAICSRIVDGILNLSLTPIGSFLCWNVGAANALLAILLLVAVSRKELPKLLLIVPILSYSFLTMLLLCGPSHRYFYFISVLILPIALFLLCSNSDCEIQSLKATESCLTSD